MARPDQQPQSQADEPHAQTQIQLSVMPESTEDQNNDEILNHSEAQSTSHNYSPINKVQVFAIVSLSIRVCTWICLLASLVILASNTSTIKGLYRDVEIHFSDIYAYRYMMSAIVIGFAYTCVQIPLDIYQVAMGKSLTASNVLPNIIFYGDKFLLSLLATGVGAAFGATNDLKKNLDQLDDFLESIGDPEISQIRSKLDNFFNMAYVSAGFLLLAFLCSVASSILSSLALRKN